MKKILLSLALFFVSASHLFAIGSGDTLDLAITPIRSDIAVSLGNATSGSVTLYNNSNQSHSFIMSAEDCTTENSNGTPLCIATSSSGANPTSLASWISFDTNSILNIPAKGKKTVSYTIRTPANAIPGGHYGAIFFNTPNGVASNGVSINRRIGSLLLVTVPGSIIVAPEFGEIRTVGPGGASSSNPSNGIEFFSASDTGTLIEKGVKIGEKLMMVFTDPLVQKEAIDFVNPFWNTPVLPTGDLFQSKIDIPVSNNGTIHISPSGKITLHEADGTPLKNIGKELIKNENGAIVGEKIVDYLTINEENGNVLPGTNRLFSMDWEGFAHQSITPNGGVSINYESPGEYYSRIERENQGYLYPWEKLSLRHTTKTLTAHIDLSYVNPLTKEVIQKQSKIPLTVSYDQIAKTWNTGLMSILVVLILFSWFLLGRKKIRNNQKSSSEYTSDEIVALERAQAIILTKKATAPKKEILKKIVRKKKTDPEKESSTKTPEATVEKKKTIRKPKVPSEKSTDTSSQEKIDSPR